MQRARGRNEQQFVEFACRRGRIQPFGNQPHELVLRLPVRVMRLANRMARR
jgi:hypothetical protein